MLILLGIELVGLPVHVQLVLAKHPHALKLHQLGLEAALHGQVVLVELVGRVLHDHVVARKLVP
eukprot:5675865-Alexandrium_andersonii.AAC.1